LRKDSLALDDRAVYHTDDTIAAIASAAGGAARGIVRLSGPGVRAILDECFCPYEGLSLAAVRSASVVSGHFELAGQHARRLEVDVYFWPDERSYTRQCVAEIHTVGSPPLLSALVGTLCAVGARPAEPGEFTLRAFLAGRIDLTQAEAVLGVIDARGEQDFKGALEQLAGGLARPLGGLRDSLLELLAQLEAGLDFVEDDIQFITPRQIASELTRASGIVAALDAQLAHDRRCDELPRAVLIGWPNVGKSSLFNALVPRGAALVCDEPGTTRDYLEATIELGAVCCQLVDTAGIEPHGGPTGAQHAGLAAQRLAASQSDRAEVRLLCLDSTRPLNDWERSELAVSPGVDRLVVFTKCDAACQASPPCDVVRTSAVSGLGLDRLRDALQQAIVGARKSETSTSLSAERCAASLVGAAAALARSAAVNRAAAGEELIAAELRIALAELGRIVGAVYTDDLLERIFSRFCIGK
jgi:tRNA modification GTPase